MSNPLVSIIIPTYNRAHLISETLDSVLAQTYQHWECIIVDDGSTDNTDEILKIYCEKDSRFQYYKRPDNFLKGGNASRNYGYKLSKGDFIQWFDDDDIMLPEFIKVKLAQFNDQIDMVICTGFYFDGEKANEIINVSVKTPLFKDYVLFRSKIFTPSVLFKRTFLEIHSLFKLDILRGQETEFFSRLFFDISESQYELTDIPLFFYRQHNNSKSFKNTNYVKEFKTSEIYVAIENLKRSLMLKDSELIQFFYRVLINFFFRALEHKDATNAKHILNTLTQLLKPSNNLLVLQLQVAGHFFLTLRRGFYKVEMYFKRYHI